MDFGYTGIDEPTQRTAAAAVTIATYPSGEDLVARGVVYEALSNDPAADKLTLGRPSDGIIDKGTPIFSDSRQQASCGAHLNGSSSVPVFASMAGLSAPLVVDMDPKYANAVVQNNTVIVDGTSRKIYSIADQKTIAEASFRRRFRDIMFVGLATGSYVPGRVDQDGAGVAAIISGAYTTQNTGPDDVKFGDYLYFKFPEWQAGDYLQVNRGPGKYSQAHRAQGRPVLRKFSIARHKVTAVTSTPVPAVTLPTFPKALTGATSKGKAIIGDINTIADKFDSATGKAFKIEQNKVLASLLDAMRPTSGPFQLVAKSIDSARETIKKTITILTTSGVNLTDIKPGQVAIDVLSKTADPITKRSPLQNFVGAIESVMAPMRAEDWEKGIGVKMGFPISNVKDKENVNVLAGVPTYHASEAARLIGNATARTSEELDKLCATIATLVNLYATCRELAYLNASIYDSANEWNKMSTTIRDLFEPSFAFVDLLGRFLFVDINVGNALHSSMEPVISHSVFMGLAETATGNRFFTTQNECIAEFWVPDAKKKLIEVAGSDLLDDINLLASSMPSDLLIAKFKAPPYGTGDTGDLTPATGTNAMPQNLAIFAIWAGFRAYVCGAADSLAGGGTLTVDALDAENLTLFWRVYGDEIELVRDWRLAKRLVALGPEALEATYDEASRLKDAAATATASYETLETSMKDLRTATDTLEKDYKSLGVENKKFETDLADSFVQQDKILAKLKESEDKLKEQTKYYIGSKADITTAQAETAALQKRIDDHNARLAKYNLDVEFISKSLKTSADKMIKGAYALLKTEQENKTSAFITSGKLVHEYPCMKVIKGGGPGDMIDVLLL